MDSPDRSTGISADDAARPTGDAGAALLASDVGAPPPPPRGRSLWIAALLAGVFAGALAGLVGEKTYWFFKPVLVSTVINGKEGLNATLDTIDDATVLNAMLTFGLLGGALGLALGASSGLARRATRMAIVAGLLGLVLGALAGVGAAAAILPAGLKTNNFQEDSLLRPFLLHSGVWVPLGIAGGLAFGLGAGCRRWQLLAAALGGGFGALAGTGVYELIGSAAFPFAQTDRTFSLTAESRVLARLCVAIGAAVGAALLCMTERRRSSPSAS